MEEYPHTPKSDDVGSPPAGHEEMRGVTPPNSSSSPAGTGTLRDVSREAAEHGYAKLLSPPSKAPDFTSGIVLSRSWRTMMDAPGLYIGLALIPGVPSFLGAVTSDPVTALGMSILESFLGLILQAAVAYAVYRSMTGDRATAGESLAKGLRRFFPVLGASIVVGMMTTAGYILLVIPGLILTCIFAVTIPACVVEHTGPLDSLQRSSVLTKNYRWTVLFLLGFVVAINTVVTASTIPLVTLMPGGGLYMNLLVYLVLLLPTAFQSIMTAVMYYTLREVKEGVSVDSLANVFD